MNDLTPLSTEDLIRLRDGIRPPQQQQQQQPQAQPEMDLSSISTEDLLKMRDQFAPKVPDKYQQAAEADYTKREKAGMPVDPGHSRLVAQGLTLGTADEILAAATTPLEMISQGTWNPIEGYRYAKAKEDYALKRLKEDKGWTGTAAEVAGGVGAAVMLAPLSATAKLAKLATSAPTTLGARQTAVLAAGVPAKLGARTVASIKDGAVLGGVSGWGGGDGLEDSLKSGAIGTVAGGAVGSAMPLASDIVRAAAKPVTSWVSRMRGTEKFGDRQIAQAAMEAGKTPAQIERAVMVANARGSEGYNVADALGKPGQDRLRSVVSAPGGSAAKVNKALDARQADQGGRAGTFLADALDAPRTALQEKTALEATRKTAANIDFPAARAAAGRVDMKPAIAAIDDLLAPSKAGGVVPKSPQMADDSIERVMHGFRARLTDGKKTLTDYNAADRLYQDVSKKAFDNRGTPIGRHLSNLKMAMSDAMEAASPGFKAANAKSSMYRGMEEAVDIGSAQAAPKIRAEDAKNTFTALKPEQRGPYRVGLADRLISSLPNQPGADATRNLIGKRVQDKITDAAGQRKASLLRRQLDREHTMSQTRATAQGGSSTTKNLNIDAAVDGADILVDAGRGKFMSALVKGVSRVGDPLTGKTEPVRARMAEILMMGKATPGEISSILAKPFEQLDRKEKLILMLLRGTQGAGSTGARMATENN